MVSSKGSTSQFRRLGGGLWVGKIPWKRAWRPTPVLLPGECNRLRNLVGWNPWGHKESDTTEQLNWTEHASRASRVAQLVKNQPATWETWVWSLGWEDILEEDMATHPSVLAWRMHMDRGAWWAPVWGSQRVGHDWAAKHSARRQQQDLYWRLTQVSVLLLLFSRSRRHMFVEKESKDCEFLNTQ